MNIEELKKALKSDEGKELIDAMFDEERKALKAKNDDLLAKLKKKDETNAEFVARLEKLEAEKAEAEEKVVLKSGDVEKIKEQLEAKHKKEIEKLSTENQKLSGQLQNHVIGEGLTAALAKAKVAPQLMDAAKALINTKFKGEIGDADGKPFAKFDGKTAEEFVTGWSQSDEGKAFVLANANSGGGSNGANGNGNAGAGKKSMTRTEFDALPAMEKVKVSKEGVVLADA